MEYGITWYVDEDGNAYGGSIRQGCCALSVECTKKNTRRYPYECWYVEVTDNGVDFQTIYICDTEQQARAAAKRLTTFIDNEAEKIDKESRRE